MAGRRFIPADSFVYRRIQRLRFTFTAFLRKPLAQETHRPVVPGGTGAGKPACDMDLEIKARGLPRSRT